MLIPSKRHTRRDLEHWEYLTRLDIENARRWTDKRMTAAMETVRAFASEPCRIEVSWGKDSVALAHIAVLAQHLFGFTAPLVWVRAEPWANPDCLLVRDAFLNEYPDTVYHEIVTYSKERAPKGALTSGFKQADDLFGERYITGIRADESAVRAIRMRRWGSDTKRTCAPLGWWKAQDIWTHLHVFNLPVHPAYACSFGGTLDRDWLRVSTLGGSRGNNMGRAEWERHYYRRELRELRKDES